MSEHLRQYIDRLFQLRQEMNETLTEKELEAIALDTGMTLTDWEALKQKAKNALTRANGYVQYQRWDDAIAELEQALEILPLGLEIREGLASAYEQRYYQKRKASDRQQAEMYAKQCLQIQPDYQPALERLGNLDRAISTQKKRRQQALLLVGTGCVALLALWVGAFWVYFDRRLPIESPDPTTSPVTPTPSNQSASDNFDTSPNALPITFVVPPDLQGVSLDAPVSRFNIHTTNTFYVIEAIVANQSDREIREMNVTFDWLDEQDISVISDSRSIVRKHHPLLRPGDRHAFGFTTRIPQNKASQIDRLRLTVGAVDATPAASRYDPAKPVEIAWAFEPPSELQISVGERSVRNSTNTILNSEMLTHRSVFEVTNTGGVAIEQLKLQLNFYDRSQELLETMERFLVIHSRPPLLQGETRLIGFITTDLDPSFSDYEIKVIEAR